MATAREWICCLLLERRELGQLRIEDVGPESISGASMLEADRANKRAELIALIKRDKGATLAEIRVVTKWQAHTVRGLVSILGRKGGEKIASSKNDAGPFRLDPGRRFCFSCGSK